MVLFYHKQFVFSVVIWCNILNNLVIQQNTTTPTYFILFSVGKIFYSVYKSIPHIIDFHVICTSCMMLLSQLSHFVYSVTQLENNLARVIL